MANFHIISVILNAKSAIYYEYVGDIFEAMVMVDFYRLVWLYTGNISFKKTLSFKETKLVISTSFLLRFYFVHIKNLSSINLVSILISYLPLNYPNTSCITLYRYTNCSLTVTGGIETTMKKLMGLEINLGQNPCCCLKFLKNVKITEKLMK